MNVDKAQSFDDIENDMESLCTSYEDDQKDKGKVKEEEKEDKDNRNKMECKTTIQLYNSRSKILDKT